MKNKIKDEIKIDRNKLLKPFDTKYDYMPPILKVIKFLDLLSKTNESFTWLESQHKVPINYSELPHDEDDIIIPDPIMVEEYQSMMRPVFECEEFIGENIFNFWDLIYLIKVAGNNAISVSAQEKAYARLANDPKQIALAEIEQHYQANKSQFKRRGYSAQFAREMKEKYPVIVSIKTIENLVADLNKQNDEIPR